MQLNKGGSHRGQHYRVKETIQYVDWINIMAYNILGTWDEVAQCSSPLHDPYRGIGEAFHNGVEAAVNYYIGQGQQDTKKFNLGMSFWGIAYKLKTPVSSSQDISMGLTRTYTSAFAPATPGWCTKQPGYLSYFEIKPMLNTTSVGLDDKGLCNYFVYNNDQYVDIHIFLSFSSFFGFTF